MGSADTDRLYMCIDLKCFYASVECADLGLDPFTTPLVVADGSRGKGAITLAISPALKNLLKIAADYFRFHRILSI